MKIQLEHPMGDKGWNFQISADSEKGIFHLNPKIRELVLTSFQNPIIKKAKPFLQGDCLGWLMIEFWTDDETAILDACVIFEQNLKGI